MPSDDEQACSKMLEGTAAYPSFANPQVNGQPLFHFQHPPITLPTTFFLQPPPSNIPLRIPPQTPEFRKLDEVSNNVPDMIISVEGVKQGYNEERDESISKEARDKLDRHIAARTPYAQLASKRLHAIAAISNETIFELPKSPSLPQYPAFLNGGPASRRNDSGTGLGLGIIGSGAMGMYVVNMETGRGLREFLLQKNKEMGGTRKECRGISFHDFTPEIRTLRHQNILLAHLGADGSGERIDVYEVDLPTIEVDPATGAEKQVNEPWIWILISRHVVTFDVNDRSTYVPDSSADPGTPMSSSGSTTWYTPQSSTSNSSSTQPTTVAPPPNFKHPIPTSWVVFAAPVAHLTVYPEGTESLPFTAPPPYPFMTGQRKKVQKRRDYDFSHAGVPIFEFSSSEIFQAPALDFLSVDGIGPWYPSDPYTSYTEGEYAIISREFDEKRQRERAASKTNMEREKDNLNHCGEYESDGENGVEMNWGKGVASPQKGVWWEVFYERMFADREKWKRIKRAMGRGNCRVVLRWDEWEGPAEENVDMKELGEKRITRAITRQRSGLSVVGELPIIGGRALGDSARARAVGNSQMSAKGKEKRKKR